MKFPFIKGGRSDSRRLLVLVVFIFMLASSVCVTAYNGVKRTCDIAGGLTCEQVESLSDTFDDSGRDSMIIAGSSVFEGHYDRDISTRSLLDLFYGMEGGTNEHYHDEELDTIKGLLHKEFCNVWRNVRDTVSFDMCIGLYIDEDFPSLAAKRIMLEKVDSVMTEGMLYDMPEEQLEALSLKSQMIPIPDSIPLFLKSWESNFDRWTEVYNSSSPEMQYFHIPDSRGCVVCHRIYEDPRWITYILESTISYHGGCGCPSSADYLTIDKTTGHVLSKSDILMEPSINDMQQRVRIEYWKETDKKGFPPYAEWEGEDLFLKSDGVAIINEGLLVYFHPYNIGCGAEEQYNLVLPLEECRKRNVSNQK